MRDGAISRNRGAGREEKKRLSLGGVCWSCGEQRCRNVGDAGICLIVVDVRQGTAQRAAGSWFRLEVVTVAEMSSG